MKNILKNKIIWATLSVILLLYACQDSFLEVPVTGSLDQSLLNTSLGLERSIVAAYSQVNGRANRMGSPSNWVWGSIRGGEANKGTDPGDFSDINPIQRFEAISTQGVINDKYNANYELIARANATLKLIANAAADVTEEQKVAYSAQARFLRAHGYFELKRGFNNTPYIDENIDYLTGSGDVKNDTDLWPKIEADLLYAYENLPETQGSVGKVNKWAAAAYLAKIYMYQQKFAAAKALFDLLIPAAYGGPGAGGKTSNGKTYGLVPLYANIFRASNDNNEESVWAYQAAANTGSVNNANPEFDLNWPYNTGTDGPGNCCSFFQPTFEMGNSFLTSAGLPLLDDGAGPYNPAYNLPANEILTDMGIEATSTWTATNKDGTPKVYKKDEYTTRFLPGKPYQERVYKASSENSGKDPLTDATWVLVWVENTNASFVDVTLDPRIDHSIGRRGIPYLDWPGVKDATTEVYPYVFPGKAWIRNQPNAGPYQTKKYAYYQADKGSLQDNSTWTPGYTAINYTIIRFADVLLMAAEAEIEVGSPTKAREYVNHVRARAANPAGFVMQGGVPAANYEIAQYADAWGQDDATREKVRFERKLELSGEGHRFYDLIRWSGFWTTTQNDYADKVLDAYLSYEAPKIPSGSFVGTKFDRNQDELLPLPQAQIDLKPGILTQNPGF